MTRVFISYSHHDETWKDDLARHLGVLSDIGIDVWHDRRIAAGDEWQPEIAQAIATCDVAVLLISSHFLTSQFILGQEVPPLLQRREGEGIRVIALITRPCQWRRIGWLAKLQARPKDGAALLGMSEFQVETALSDLAGEIADLSAPAVPAAAPFDIDIRPLGGARDDIAGFGVGGHLDMDRLATFDVSPLSRHGRGVSVPSVRPLPPPAHRASIPAAPPPPSAPEVALNNLPLGARHLFGREKELAALDDAWISGGRIRVLALVAPGGTGKTALVREWLLAMSQDRWRGARRVFAWSFYSQGTGDDRNASEDLFLAEALEWFGVAIDPATDAATKGQRLAAALRAQRSLLVLDGVEPLQYPPATRAAGLAGQLRAPGLRVLLQDLAEQEGPGLCVVTSREHLADLEGFERNAARPAGSALSIELANLDETDGARLLHAEGANRAGNAAIGPDDAELKTASRELKGHALTLTLLGSYLALAYAGDIRQRDQVDWQEANAETNGHAFRVIAAYERWFAGAGDAPRELAALRLLGFFDRPATKENLQALRAAPPIVGLTEPLVDLSMAQWHATLKRLQDLRLLDHDAATGRLDAHPLLREYFAAALEEKLPDAWKEGHRRLYVQLKDSVPHQPEGLEGLQPLYQAVVHGCRAGLHEETCAEVYADRILRGTGHNGYYSTKGLGAFGADLGAVVCFFTEPWWRLASGLPEAAQAWLLNAAAIRLRALGRLVEAQEPMAAGVERAVTQESWKTAAQGYGNLSELQLGLGRIAMAVADAEQAVDYADRSGAAFQRMGMRTTLADARHQQGDPSAACAGFAAAEALQAEDQPEYPLLYSLQGFRYCDLLLARAERAAWEGAPAGDEDKVCAQVKKRATMTMQWAEANLVSPLNIALDHLTLARCALYADRLHGRAPGDEARKQTEAAVAGLRQAGAQHHLPRGLLTRAWLRHCLNDIPGCEADLNEAQRIAERGGMKLHLADIALYRARLFKDKAELAKARALIEECGYGRRIPELEDAEKLLGVNPEAD